METPIEPDEIRNNQRKRAPWLNKAYMIQHVEKECDVIISGIRHTRDGAFGSGKPRYKAEFFVGGRSTPVFASWAGKCVYGSGRPDERSGFQYCPSNLLVFQHANCIKEEVVE